MPQALKSICLIQFWSWVNSPFPGCRDFDITEIDITESDVTETDIMESDITESDITESDITRIGKLI